MDFVLQGHDCEHAVQTVIQVFYPNRGYKRLTDEPETGTYLLSKLDFNLCIAYVMKGGNAIASGTAWLEGKGKRELTQALAKAIYEALSRLTGLRPPWGTLTGVRPAKIVTDLYAKGHDRDYAAAYLQNAYKVRPDKVKLCLDVAEAEAAYLSTVNNEKIGIYIGIPFCPTRCHYCSFTAYPLAKWVSLVAPYMDALFREIDFLGQASAGKGIRALYIGGGTPTALEAPLFERLLSRVREAFPHTEEFTVEAGRPDTITAEKLSIMSRYGVTRLAINPQTLSDDTLERVGRSHTGADFIRTFNMARDAGFSHINCDVILGLPGERAKDVENTFEGLAKLAPEAVTVHTLAIKRTAGLNHTLGRYSASTEGLATDKGQSGPEDARDTERIVHVAEVEEMLDIAQAACLDIGLSPYYMYRQKNMVGNFENTGWAKPGKTCAYNLQTMTEAESVYAAGAGAVTKIVHPGRILIERAYNVKNLDEYIRRAEEMIDRKRRLLDGGPEQ